MKRASALHLAGLVFFASVIFSAGCSSHRAYDRGSSLLQHGHYDSAITHLTEAVDKWPAILGENEDYLATLERAKREGAAWHYDKAGQVVADTHLASAERHLITALEYDPALEGAEQLLADVRRQITAATTTRQTARDLAERGQWDEAVRHMRDAMAQYETMPGGRQEMTRMERSAAEMHLSAARRELDRDNRDEAERLARRSLEYHETTDAQGVLRELATRHRADELVADAERMFASGQYRGAIEDIREARRLHPQRADIDALMKRARVALCERLIHQADAHLAADEPVAAMRALVECDSVLTGFEGVPDRMARIRPVLAERHLRRADAIDPDRRPGAALMEYLAAVGYGANGPGIDQAIQRCCAKICETTGYAIALVAFDAYTGDGSIAARFEAEALQTMLRASPPNVTVIDARGGMASADAVLSGGIIRSTVMQDQSSTLKTTRYQAGTELVPNPYYTDATEDLESAHRDLVRAQKNYSDAVDFFHRNHRDNPGVPPRKSSRVRRYKSHLDTARSTLRSARITLRTTPTHITRPRIVTHSYPVFDITVTAEVEVSVRMLDAATGRVLLAETAGGKARESDRYIEADPYRNVPSDPLSLPDDQTLINRAAYHAMNDLQRSVTRAMKLHGERFAILAREAQSAGDHAGAVEHAVSYLFAYDNAASDSREMLRIASDELAGEADLIPLSELLQAHCGVRAR